MNSGFYNVDGKSLAICCCVNKCCLISDDLIFIKIIFSCHELSHFIEVIVHDYSQQDNCIW